MRRVPESMRSQRANTSVGIPMRVWITGQKRLPSVEEFNSKFLPRGTEFEFCNHACRRDMMATMSRTLDEAGVVNGTLEAYKSLRPAAYKADLWRLCVLWMHGGIYLDQKMQLAQNLDAWVDLV